MCQKQRCRNCPYPEADCIGIDEPRIYSQEEIRNDLIVALKTLYRNDSYLLQVEAHETCISSLLCHYLLQNPSDHYPNLSIDPEYNRNGETSKYYKAKKDEAGYVFARPDIIIHRRKCNRYNTVYMEVKPYWNNTRDPDYEKACAFTIRDKPLIHYNGRDFYYAYQHAVSILVDMNRVELVWFSNGEKNRTKDVYTFADVSGDWNRQNISCE